MNTNIEFNVNSTKKELLEILSNLKKTHIVDMMNTYNQNNNKSNLKIKKNNTQKNTQKNTQNLHIKPTSQKKTNQKKTNQKTKNQKTTNKKTTNQKSKEQENDSSIYVEKEIIKIPNNLTKLKFKKARSNNFQYEHI